MVGFLGLMRTHGSLRPSQGFFLAHMCDLLICTGELAAGWLVVIASTESRSVAAMLQWQGIPAVCNVPPDAPAVFRHHGLRLVTCPATRPGIGVQCNFCCGRWGVPLCVRAGRSFVITFANHGTRAAVAAARHCS